MVLTHSQPHWLLSHRGSHFLPLQPVLMHSTPSYAPCHSHHHALLSITLQDRQLPACLPASSTQLHNRVDSRGGWWAGSLLTHLGRLLKWRT